MNRHPRVTREPTAAPGRAGTASVFATRRNLILLDEQPLYQSIRAQAGFARLVHRSVGYIRVAFERRGLRISLAQRRGLKGL